MLNKVELIGYLGNDPELVTFDGGGKIVKASIATSETYKDKQVNEKKTITEWHNLVFGMNSVDTVMKFLNKGSKIFVEGKIRTRVWEKDGEKRYSTDVVVRNFLFLDSKPKDNSNYEQYNEAKPVEKKGAENTAQEIDDDLPF